MTSTITATIVDWDKNDKVPAIHFGLKPKTYTVTFDSNGGSEVAEQTVIHGESVSAPDPAPTRSGCTLAGWTLDGEDYDFSDGVPEDITLVAKWSAETFYVDENGTRTENVTATVLGGSEKKLVPGTYFVNSDLTYDRTLTLGGGETTLNAGWYVVNSDVTYTGQITLGGNVNIILCDGKTMTISSDMDGISGNNGGTLTIYGQTLGTGTLDITGADKSINDDGNVVICGGTVTATGTYGYGIFANGSVTITGGKVTATSTESEGIYGAIGITLGWTSASDRIYATRYGGGLTIADGQRFYSGSEVISGISIDMDMIAGKTLQPCILLTEWDPDDYDDRTGALTPWVGQDMTAAFRAFLKYEGDETSLQARATRSGGAGVPDRIAVRLLDRNGETQGIGEIRLSTGEVTFDPNAWYDLNGRRLAGKPTTKGIYINGGHKVVIK